jgi:hypothetical protein
MNEMKVETYIVLDRLQKMGFSREEANQLRRIALTLRRWFERKCGDANGNCIERDEATGKPFRTFENGPGPRGRCAVADQETGARKRLVAIMARYKRRLVAYIQGDCRGASLYILRRHDLKPGESIDSVYNRGVAVY